QAAAERRLAGTGLTDERERLAPADVERDLVERDDLAPADAAADGVALRHPGGLEQHLAHPAAAASVTAGCPVRPGPRAQQASAWSAVIAPSCGVRSQASRRSGQRGAYRQPDGTSLGSGSAIRAPASDPRCRFTSGCAARSASVYG